CAVRRETQIWRGVGLASSNELFSIARATEVLRRAWIQFDWPGLLVLGATLAATIWLAFRRRGARFQIAMLGAAALGQVVFFYRESFSTYWTGYPRFQLLAQALLGVG